MRLLAFARVELGLSEYEFWRLTPAKLIAFVEQRKAVIEREDYRSGWIAYVVRSIMGDKEAHPLDGFRPQKKPQKTQAQIVRENMKAHMDTQKKRKR